MSPLLELAITAGVVLSAAALAERVRLRRYWRRACTGFAWRRRFPNASKVRIRSFLTLFVDAFGFPEARRLCFRPEDQPLEVYRALYPVPWLVGDSMELETFIQSIHETFGVDLLASWRKDITLGELYAIASS